MGFIALIRCDSKKKGYKCMVGILNLWFFVSCPLLFAAYKEYIEKRHYKKKIILLIILSLWPQIFSVDHSALVSLAVLVSGKETFSTVIFLPRTKGKTFELFRFQGTYLLNHFLLEVVTHM